MEPRIQYAKPSDGVSIAYAVFGKGPAIVFPSSIWGNIHLYKSGRLDPSRAYDELVARGWSVITYDGRGTGSSDRDVEDYTLEGRMRDVEAVVNRVAPDHFALCGVFQGGPTSVSYAVQHPDRVTHLVLTNTFANAREYYELIPAMRISQQTLRDAEVDWEFATLTLANALSGYTDTERARRLAEVFQTGMTPKGYVAFRDAAERIDVQDLLAQIGVPTLVVHDSSSPIERVGIFTQRLAPLIPNAQFVETDNLAQVMDEFLREGNVELKPDAAAEPSTFRSVLFTDIVGHTEMMSRLGDERGREVLREHERITREVLKAHGGTEVKTMGDGFMASFGSVTKAVECAVGLQRGMDERNRGEGVNRGVVRALHEEGRGDISPLEGDSTTGNDPAATGAAPLRTDVEPIVIRVGLNAGEPIEEEGPDGRSDLFGATVILASRIAARAEGGEILVADTVRGLCSGKGFSFADRGEFTAKGFEEPVRVYEVRWRE